MTGAMLRYHAALQKIVKLPQIYNSRAVEIAREALEAQTQPSGIPLHRAPRQGPFVLDRPLTPREHEVLALIACGKTSKDIASVLGISFKTVICHRSRVLNKLGLHNASDLTRFALRNGLITDPDEGKAAGTS